MAERFVRLDFTFFSAGPYVYLAHSCASVNPYMVREVDFSIAICYP